MADAPSPEGGASTPSSAPSREFSKPTGVNDDAVWEKHFGKGGKAEKALGEPAKKPEAKPKPKADASEKADPKAPKPKADKEPAKEPKRAEGKEAPDKASKADTKTEKAKPGSEQPSEADKKPAGKSAQPPEESDPGDAKSDVSEWTEARKWRDGQKQKFEEQHKKSKAELDAQAKKNDERIDQAVQQLQPAITVMRKLNEAKLGDKLTLPMVERAVKVMRGIAALEEGDFTVLGEVISEASGKPPDEAMKLFVRGVKTSPEGRAARAQAQAAEARAAEAERRIAEMEKKLQERDEQKTVQERQAQAEQRRTAYLEEIETDLHGHPVLQLPRGKERVMKLLIKTADKVLKAPTLSFEEAADKVVGYEKERLRRTRFLEDGGDPPAADGDSRSRVRTVPRGETAESGVKNASAEARFSAIFDKHTQKGGRR